MYGKRDTYHFFPRNIQIDTYQITILTDVIFKNIFIMYVYIYIIVSKICSYFL